MKYKQKFFLNNALKTLNVEKIKILILLRQNVYYFFRETQNDTKMSFKMKKKKKKNNENINK